MDPNETIESLKKDLQTFIDSGKATDKAIADLKAQVEATTKALQEKQDFDRTFHLSGVDSGKVKFAATLGAFFARQIAKKEFGGNLDHVTGYQGEFKEMGEQMHSKAASFQVDSSGGLLVPTALLINEFVDNYRPDPETIFDLGARKVDLAPGTGTAVIPRKTGNSTSYTLSENGTPMVSALTLENVQITPHRHSVLTGISNRLMFSVPEIMRIWTEDMMREWDIASQLFALYGSGQNPQPTGLYNVGGVLSVDLAALTGDSAAGRFMSYTDIANLEDALLLADAPLKPSHGLLVHPRAVRQMKTERIAQYSGVTTQAGTMPVFANNAALASISSENLTKAIGYKFAANTQIVKNRTYGSSSAGMDVFFGDWSQLGVYNFGMKLKTSDQATVGGVNAWSNDLTYIMVDGEIDILVKQPKALVIGKGLIYA